MLTGSWCTPEIMKPVRKGYQVLHIHEAWHLRTFKSYPYGYAQFTGFDAQDILNIGTLI